MSGLLAKSILLPTDNIKKRLQVQGFQEFNFKYNGMINCLRVVIDEQGIRALYRGFTPSVLKVGIF
jgi:Mitochondrial carrier protein.